MLKFDHFCDGRLAVCVARGSVSHSASTPVVFQSSQICYQTFYLSVDFDKMLLSPWQKWPICQSCSKSVTLLALRSCFRGILHFSVYLKPSRLSEASCRRQERREGVRSEFELYERSCEARKRELGHPCPHEHELSSLREWERLLIYISLLV